MKKVIFLISLVLGLTGCGNKEVNNETLVNISQDEVVGINVSNEINNVVEEKETDEVNEDIKPEKNKKSENSDIVKEENKADEETIEKSIIDNGKNSENVGEEMTLEPVLTDNEIVYEIGVDVGKKAINFEVELLTGEKVKLSDYSGKAVFLNFWATWCGPCVGELPDIEKIKNEYGDRLVVLAINGGELKEDVKKFIDLKGYTFNVGVDESGSILNTYDSMFIPLSIFIDENGIIKERRVGALSEIEMRNIIDSFIEAK